MDIFINITTYCIAFGCGWAAGLFFVSESEPDETIDIDLESDQTIDLGSTEDPIALDKPNRSRLFQFRKTRRWRQRRYNRRRHQRYLPSKKERLYEPFYEHRCIFIKREKLFKRNTRSIENLDATLTNLNETLKNKTENVFSHPPVEEYKPDDVDVIEDVADTTIGKSPLKNPELRILFPPHLTHYPEFSGRPRDASANMHIYDANFEVPRCNDTWSLNIPPMGSDESNGNAAKKFPGMDSVSREEKTSSSLNELRGMFQDCRKGNLPNANKVGMLTKQGGGYASMGDLNKKKEEQEVTLVASQSRPKKKSRERFEGSAQKSTLSRGDELDIINSFSSMKSLGWEEAVNLAQEQGYHLHATYINELPNYISEYSKTVLGVKVKDISFDCSLGSDHRGFGKEAVVTAVIDVGGQDTNHRA